MKVQYEEDHSGNFFHVLLFKDFVVKLPKKEVVDNDERLEHIANIQTYLSNYMEEVMPCYKIGRSLIMPRVYGVSADKLPQRGKEIRELIDDARDRIRKLGYDLRDANLKNVLYNEETGKIYLIDFHNVRKLK